jgi:dTMP kinase
MQGRLITFEGIDGVGKSTHAALLAAHLREQDLPVELFREPGGTVLGESLRSLIKSGSAESGLSELLLFAAARAELVQRRLKPLLADGAIVILDRFTDSSVAYQGALDDVDDGVLVSVCLAAAGGLYPDLTFWFDLEPEQALKRRGGGSAQSELPIPGGRPADAIERRTIAYFTRVRERYLSIYHSDRERVQRVDCSGSVEQTWQIVRGIADAALEQWRSPGKLNGAAH